ncbi:hypothetical protein AB0K14_03005 [Actinosynnema sp. NPDC050801]|uniref:hypothetical protein n=1 Tax=unclassified Actinosynnema TaxID=2637065 RepID=UPI0033C15E75
MIRTAPGQRAVHGPPYQRSSTCTWALSVSGWMAGESNGHTSTHSRQRSMQGDSSIVTGTPTR